MNFIFYVEIKHTPQYKNGAYRRTYFKCTARNPQNALRQAAQHCIDNNIDAVSYDASWEGIPVCKKTRFKWLNERREAKDLAKSEQMQRLIDYDPATALTNPADS